MKRLRSLWLPLAMLALTGPGVAYAQAGQVPLRGAGTGTIIGQEVLGPTQVRLIASSEGLATHLGRYSRTEQLDLNPATGAFTGWVRFIAANGDALDCTMVGGFVSAADAVGTYTIVGGTGRFAGATGEARFAASLVDASHFVVSFRGSLDW